MSLEELIARQRFMLNRTTRAAKLPAAEQPNPQAADLWAAFEKKSADGAKELTEVLEKKFQREFPTLREAEKRMRAAGDELAARRFPPVPPHDQEALTQLIKTRDTVRIRLADPPPGCNLAELRQFDRIQAQKLRRPRELDEKEEAEQLQQLPQRLEDLAKEEEFVYATIKQQLPLKTPPDAPPSDNSSTEPAERSTAKAKTEQRAQAAAKAEQKKAGQPKDGERKDDEHKDVQQLQAEVAAEARAIERAINRLAARNAAAASELARQRMRKAAEKAEQAASALDRGNRREARGPAEETSRALAELSAHMKGLLARQLAERLAAAREAATNLARSEHALADRLARAEETKKPGKGMLRKGMSEEAGNLTENKKPGAGKELGSEGNQPGDGNKPGEGKKPGAGKEPGSEGDQPGDGNKPGEGKKPGPGKEPGSEGDQPGDGKQPGSGRDEPGVGGEGSASHGGLVDAVGRAAEGERTLDDLLRAVAQADDKTTVSPETLEKIERLIAESAAAAAIRQLEQLQPSLRAGQTREAAAEIRGIAEKTEAVAHRLDALYRAVVAPQVEALVALERQAATLREELQKLESQPQISDWHRRAEQFLHDVAKQAGDRRSAGTQSAAKLVEAMQDQGWGGGVEHWRWERRDVRFMPPAVYGEQLHVIIMDIQEQIREMVLRDLATSDDEPIPPQYRELVKRYFEVLLDRPGR